VKTNNIAFGKETQSVGKIIKILIEKKVDEKVEVKKCVIKSVEEKKEKGRFILLMTHSKKHSGFLVELRCISNMVNLASLKKPKFKIRKLLNEIKVVLKHHNSRGTEPVG
jgi:hypothetical protein